MPLFNLEYIKRLYQPYRPFSRACIDINAEAQLHKNSLRRSEGVRRRLFHQTLVASHLHIGCSVLRKKVSQNQAFKRLHHFYVNRTQPPLTKKQSLREISQIMHSYFFKEIPRISATVCRLSRFTLTNCVIFALFFCLIASCSSSYLP